MIGMGVGFGKAAVHGTGPVKDEVRVNVLGCESLHGKRSDHVHNELSPCHLLGLGHWPRQLGWGYLTLVC